MQKLLTCERVICHNVYQGDSGLLCKL